MIAVTSHLEQHWRRSYENTYLGAWDLHDGKQYRRLVARIDRVSDETVTGEMGRKSKPVQLHLVSLRTGKQFPPMIVTKTTGKTLQIMFGEVPLNWVGKEITVFVRRAKRVQKGTGDVLDIVNTKAGDDLKRDLRGESEPEQPKIDPAEFADDGQREPGQEG